MRLLLILALALGPSPAWSLTKELSWKEVDQLEVRLEKWVEQMGSEKLIAFGRIKQRPPELEWTRALFPWLLPEGFAGKPMDMTCAPHFQRLRENKDQANYQSWHQCLRELYRDHLPTPYAIAVRDLMPKK